MAKQKAPKALDIYSYFTRELGRNPDDITLKKLPVDSGCGDPCADAIDHAAALLAHVESAIGTKDHDSVKLREALVRTTELVVSVYWRG